MAKFEIDKTYFARSVCDYNCKFFITVAKRTEKSIITAEGKTLRITVWEGVEHVRPMGTYSMAPIVGADKLAD